MGRRVEEKYMNLRRFRIIFKQQQNLHFGTGLFFIFPIKSILLVKELPIDTVIPNRSKLLIHKHD